MQLGLRFGLEVASLIALGKWGRHAAGSGILSWMAAVAAPCIAAALWTTFAVPNDPSRSGRAPVAVPGWARLALEGLVFGGGAWALAALQSWTWCALDVLGLIVHHAFTTARLSWLWKQ